MYSGNKNNTLHKQHCIVSIVVYHCIIRDDYNMIFINFIINKYCYQYFYIIYYFLTFMTYFNIFIL